MSKNAFDRIKSGASTPAMEAEKIKLQSANRPVYKKLPSHVLVEDFLAPNYLDIRDVINVTKINPKRMQAFLHGETRIDPFLADKLGRFFNTGSEYWLNLQAEYDAKGTL